MKNLLVILIALTASSAFATKARNTALGSALHLKGTQTVYSSPYHLMELNNFVAFETGKTTATTAGDGAEGSILMNTSETSKLLLSVGHQDETTLSQRAAVNGAAAVVNDYKIQQNPIEAIYAWKDGDNVWGIGTYYSNFNNKKNGEKESSAGLRLAASYGAFKWKANIGLINSAVNTAGDKLNNDIYFNLGLRYSKDTIRYGIDFTTWNASETLAAGTTGVNISKQDINLRILNVEKVDNGEFFYGAGLRQQVDKDKATDIKTTRLNLPFIMGAEYKATDWLQLRGSITQDVIISQSKVDNGADIPAGANTTQANAGVGLLWGKAQLDATLGGLVGAAANQKVDLAANNFFGQVGLVYNY